MISRKTVCNTIDEASHYFLHCWEMLTIMKSHNIENGSVEKVLEFQCLLAKTLLKLEQMYVEVSHEANSIVDRKTKLSPEWFRRRLKTLDVYKDAIKSTLSIGKSLGDAYAWFFYQRSQPLLFKHQQHEKSIHISSGIGGIGEVSLICNRRAFEGFYVLYHGITTILRIGDISLVDMKTFKVVAIGEIKSTELDPENIQVTVLFSGPEFNQHMAAQYSQKEPVPMKLDLPPHRMARFGRQMDRITNTFAGLKTPDDRLQFVLNNTYVEALERLGRQMRAGRAVTTLAGDGLLLIGFRVRHTKLSSRVVPNSGSDSSPNWNMEGVKEAVANIVLKHRDGNTLAYQTLHYNKTSEPYFLPGTTPLFWWPIDAELLKKIIFRETIVVTVFNQAYLILKLRQAGFEINTDDKTKQITRVYKTTQDGMVIAIENLSYYLWLIQLSLFTEEAIVQILNHTVLEIEAKDIDPYTKIQLAFEQHIFTD